MQLNKQILEAIKQGINLALDDYDDEVIKPISSKSNVVKNDDIVKNKLIWDTLIDKFDDVGEITKEELSKISELSKTYGFKYVHENNPIFLNDTVDYICKINPNADLNWIDVSNLTSLRGVFAYGNAKKFNGDISKWDVSNVTDMFSTFLNSQFNGDISKWNVSNVACFANTFKSSKFNGDISNWDVSNAHEFVRMFAKSEFNGDLSKWDVHNGNLFNSMFADSKFNNMSIESWQLRKPAVFDGIFSGSAMSVKSLTHLFNKWGFGKIIIDI